MITSYNSLVALLEAFPNEESCVKHLERMRWPMGIVCPCCDSSRKFARITRGFKYKCADCHKEFSVRKGTIFEESRLQLRKWFIAVWLVTSNRKGIASTQLSRELGVTQKTAWFMLGRLREVAIAFGCSVAPMEGTVEADESYFGGKEKNKHASKRTKHPQGRQTDSKTPVVALVERDGFARAFPVCDVKGATIRPLITENVKPGSRVITDELRSYIGLHGTYEHASINHSDGVYVRGDVHTNSVESFWALFKRGHYGVFHKMSGKHLHRYAAEFSARWNMRKLGSGDRVDLMLQCAPGQRLTYKRLIA